MGDARSDIPGEVRKTYPVVLLPNLAQGQGPFRGIVWF